MKLEFLLLVALTTSKPLKESTSNFQGRSAVPIKICQQIADDIIVQGGSAVDSAISAALCTGVINSYASGIGGGAFMLIKPSKYQKRKIPLYDTEGKLFKTLDPVMIDCREVAPIKATETSSSIGGLAIGVPGELHCFDIAHKAWGRLPWKSLFVGAIKAARDGFVIDTNLALRIHSAEKEIRDSPGLSSFLTRNGKLLKLGDIAKRPNLAVFLDAVAEQGICAFYTGKYAESMVKTIQSNGGILSMTDFKNYRAKLRRPVNGTYRGYDLLTTQAPSSGPVLISLLNIAEKFDVSKKTEESTQIIVEAIKFGTAQRTYFGEPTTDGLVQKDLEYFKDKVTAKENADRLNLQKTFDAEYYTPLKFASTKRWSPEQKESGTCHISVLGTYDGEIESFEGVGITTTVNKGFGSTVMDMLTGALFNNQMDDFAHPNTLDSLNHPSNPRNFIKPGKRPVSSMVPTILVNTENKHLIVVGGSGGKRIYPSVFQNIISIVDVGLDSASSVASPRMYHSLSPNSVEIEKSYPEDLKKGLVNRGHVLLPVDVVKALVQVVQFKNGRLDAAADSRLYSTGQ